MTWQGSCRHPPGADQEEDHAAKAPEGQLRFIDGVIEVVARRGHGCACGSWPLAVRWPLMELGQSADLVVDGRCNLNYFVLECVHARFVFAHTPQVSAAATSALKLSRPTRHVQRALNVALCQVLLELTF